MTAGSSFLSVLQPNSVLPHLNQPYSSKTHWQTTKIFQVLIIHSLKIFIYSPSVPWQIHGEPFRFITWHWSLWRSLSDPLKSLVKGKPYLTRPLLFKLNSVRQTLVRLSNNSEKVFLIIISIPEKNHFLIISHPKSDIKVCYILEPFCTKAVDSPDLQFIDLWCWCNEKPKQDMSVSAPQRWHPD